MTVVLRLDHRPKEESDLLERQFKVSFIKEKVLLQMILCHVATKR